ncbi:hypothetical protein [Tahibacter amnicola]|uniref:Uncharacterized protein n=1 Tax=Tahibacter amnicola TaxID=2976241 RepID=A0ABY6BKN4_9GAMM|nr:hypothetical protein [Tahibacter amnicola]UXI70329.1 hypothetical protein N4264_12040 [Tahibacter amnicola]
MNEATTPPCPTCHGPSRSLGRRLHYCDRCKQRFYPLKTDGKPDDASAKAQIHIVRSARLHVVREAITTGHGIRIAGAGFFLIAILQILFGVVIVPCKRCDTKIYFRSEEPDRYWKGVTFTFVLGSALFGVGHFLVKRHRADLPPHEGE